MPNKTKNMPNKPFVSTDGLTTSNASSHWNTCKLPQFRRSMGGGPRVVFSTAAFHARVRGSVPGLGGLKETKMFLPHLRVKVSIVESLRDREVACSASDRQGWNFESCVWRTVSSQSSHHPQEVLLAQFSLYVHKGGLKPDLFHFHRSISLYLLYKPYSVAYQYKVFNVLVQNQHRYGYADQTLKCYRLTYVWF